MDSFDRTRGVEFAPADHFMDAGRFRTAYTFGFGIALVCVIWLLIPVVRDYFGLVAHAKRESPTAAAAPQKLSASNLEAAIRQSRQFPPKAQIQCRPAERDWDYVCSFIAKPSQSRGRLQFGVVVDGTHWLKVSGIVSVGTPVPSPR